jgi:cbb3-type cytochrome oxidase maturation protein
MSVIFVLIPLSIAMAAVFLGAFIWAVRSGQYEDTTTPSLRLLMEEDTLKHEEDYLTRTGRTLPQQEVAGSEKANERTTASKSKTNER